MLMAGHNMLVRFDVTYLRQDFSMKLSYACALLLTPASRIT